MMRSRFALIVLSLLVVALAVLSGVLIVRAGRQGQRTAAAPASNGPASLGTAAATNGSSPGGDGTEPTRVRAHNLLLRKGPDFRVYVRWLRGEMGRANRRIDPSFDDPDSFFLAIQSGVLRANIGDITNYLNTEGLKNSPLKNVSLKGDGDQIRLTGTLHKGIPLPVEMVGTLSAIPENSIQIHVTKLSALKIPIKGLLKTFRVTLADLVPTKNLPGVTVNGNDIVFDTQTLLPPPHIRGQLTAVRVANPDLEEVYGNAAEQDVSRVEQWRNFLSLKGGTIDFGKLTMHHVDLIMIDISKDPWFDLDLTQYQAQLVNGYTRMTPEAGLQIFMPDVRDLPKDKPPQNISLQWLRNRNQPPPPDVTPKH